MMGITPLPFYKMVVVCVLQFTEAVVVSQVIPYMPFLVQLVLDIDDDSDPQIAQYSGILIASFSIAQVPTAHLWGYLSDRIGRKPVLMIGFIGNAVTTTFFGFTNQLWIAFAARISQGLINGNQGVVITYLGEFTDSTNQAKGFAIMSLSYGVGLAFGPSFGGLLYDVNYPGLEAFPALTACLATAALSLTTIFLAYFKMDETYKPKKVHKRRPSKDDDVLLIQQNVPEEVEEDISPYRELIAIPPFRVAVILYMCAGFVFLAFVTVYPLWAMVSEENGGWGWDTGRIGSVLTFGIITTVIFNIFVFDRMVRWIGLLNVFRISWMIPMMMFLSFAFIVDISDENYRYGTLVGIYLCHAGVSSMIFTTSKMLINNSVYREILGTANGVGQALASAARAAGPAVGGALFGWGIAYEKIHPNSITYVDRYFPFFLCAVLGAFAIVISFAFPKRYNIPRPPKYKREYLKMLDDEKKTSRHFIHEQPLDDDMSEVSSDVAMKFRRLELDLHLRKQKPK